MGASSGHGITLAYEADPTGSPGVFTTIGQLVSDLPIDLMRGSTETSPHNVHIDEYVFDGRFQRGPWAITVNYDHGDASHTGLRTHLTAGTTFGLRWRGPGITDTTDEIIVSGQLTNWRRTTPVRTGAQGGEGNFQPSSLMKIDGVVTGT